MNFSRFLDIQSWWEVPSIAYFCSLFRTAFNLLDFDIEELEEALLTDGTEESACSLLTELIVRLLKGCLGNNEISAFNYQMYLRRLFRRKCQETNRYNPFNTDIDFQFLPLRSKVEILYALCDFRLDAEDVYDLFKNLEAESLRVEPLGWDDNDCAYWYFYGTRLYREDLVKKPKGKSKKKRKESRKRGWFYGDDWLEDEETERVWQVVCFTEEDWTHLTAKFKKATSKVEKELYRSLSQNFLPEIPRLFQEKERLQRKRLLELAPRRTSSRVLQKIKQKEEEDTKQSAYDSKEDEDSMETPIGARAKRAKRREMLRSKSASSDTSDNSSVEKEIVVKKAKKRAKKIKRRSVSASSSASSESPPEPVVRSGRKTNNSLASATGQIVIPDNDEPISSSTRKKLKTSQIFRQSEEDMRTDMYKVLEQLTAHDDAWPFMEPVEEEYAPNYYAVIRRPMNLRAMEKRLDKGDYIDFSMFKADFKLIVNNCRLYNGQDNEYTTMVDNLQAAFDRLTEKYVHRPPSSDEEIAVEYQIPTPSRKHKLKSSESPERHKKKKRRSHSSEPASADEEPKSNCPENSQEEEEEGQAEENDVSETQPAEESHKSKHDKGKKKRKSHHRHGKHSKNHKRNHKSNHESKRHNKKHGKDKDRESKKSKQKKKKNKHQDIEPPPILKRSESQESLESSNRSRSASPLPSIHTPSPSPTEMDKSEQSIQSDPDLRDKFDKIKERSRNASKEAWESLFDHKQKAENQKPNLNIPGKNPQLSETIQKLKAKNEQYKETAAFNSLFTTTVTDDSNLTNKVSKDIKGKHKKQLDDNKSENSKIKASGKRSKKSSAKNESASVALEQAVKDISKWLDDAPKASTHSSPCDSPAHTISTEDQDNSRLDDDLSQGERISLRIEIHRKRPSSRDPKILKRREIQRTIERSQPGKSKGNLLVNKNTEKLEEATSSGTTSKPRDSNKKEPSLKISLGSVLPTVEFTLGNDHNFSNNEDKRDYLDEEQDNTETTEVVQDDKPDVVVVENKPVEVITQPTKRDVEVETDPQMLSKPSQEKATPNLSAWFKAFGTPKASTSSSPTIKKKIEEAENQEKAPENTKADVATKVIIPKGTAQKLDSLYHANSPLPEGGDSPYLSVMATPRLRRTSTGSTISERSSFSQDLDSPRHQMSHNSPLLSSPASPRTEDFQKITYPIINGSVRAGFYQDTTSLKSSPDKSCSPREGPQSPYSPYAQHVYASNSATGSTTPIYSVDHNKSPLPTYGVNAPPYYDTSKAPVVSKPGRVHADYTALGPDTFNQNHYNGPYSPVPSPYPPSQSNYSQPLVSPQPEVPVLPPPNPIQLSLDHKNTSYPVKKRIYNEPTEKLPEVIEVEKEILTPSDLVKPTYTNMPQSVNSVQQLSSTTVDDIALALIDKSEISKTNIQDEPSSDDYTGNTIYRNRENAYERSIEPTHGNKRNVHDTDFPKHTTTSKKDNIDMINMGYMNAANRRISAEHADIEFSNTTKTNPLQKGYEIEAIAINLGINNQHLSNPKPIYKSTSGLTNNTPAHSHERIVSEVSNNQTIAHAHQNQYDPLPNAHAISNFSLNDIELANKKLYSCSTITSSTAIDYGNWKTTNPIRTPETLPTDYSTVYSAVPQGKLKSTESNPSLTALNYKQTIPTAHYNNYNNINRSNSVRTQELQQNHLPELRIPTPRVHKNDVMTISSPIISDSISKTAAKNTETHAKPQKTDKLAQAHPLVAGLPYKTPYGAHTTLPIETLRNLPNIPQMLERYTNDERYLQSFAPGTSLYHEKTFQMAQMFNKSLASEVHPSSTSVGIYTQPTIVMSKDNNIYKMSNVSSTQVDPKKNSKRRKTSETKQAQVVSSQAYHNSHSNDVMTSMKTSMIPSGPFNFGTTANMTLGSMYGDNSGFTIEDFRNSTNQIMAANYMAAAVAHQQRSNEVNAEKLAKPAHQNSNHSQGSFPFLGSQVRPGYPFGTEPSSPLYQQYLQRYQEELQRQTGAQIMGLYPPSYPTSLGVRQPYDSINRPSWL